MRKLIAVSLIVLVLAGCRKASPPELRIASGMPDAVKQASVERVEPVNEKVVGNLGPNAKIVTGVPATAEDKSQATAPTPEDDPGAVAVKMEY